ncbi:MAG: bifunctional transaldolase/phosoglucose isomerase [Deltaproteobacteria bacterium]|jgi:transaldolase/glucose-6-phosphate isomerase|nr:bifunctional transaldolase/phosoglucose isomerase [Deltaproteobacteria bacterium]
MPSDPSTPLHRAHACGQSIWLDNISRDLLLSGELRRWVETEGIRGVTSNPAIFEKAIAKSSDYDPATRALIAQGAADALDVFERLAVADIQLGCDVLRTVWEESDGRDGFVSLEVSPHLAHDTEETILEAHRLAQAVARDNLMIKVPATPEGIPAIQQLIADGINVNVTLLFAVDAYEAVHQAYLAGLESRVARGLPISHVNSVASFFVSRIDAAVAQHLATALESETRDDRRARLEALDAKVAIANAKLAYARFLETLAGERWQKLAAAGAHPQRVLWASTGTKDPALPMTLYVDTLIGQHTVNTLPDATLAAFRKEGVVSDALGQDPVRLKDEAQAVLSELDALGISLKEITDTLLSKGCVLFSEAFDGLLLSVETKRQQLLGDGLSQTHYALGGLTREVEAATESWQAETHTRNLWRRHAELFTDGDESDWMGWLDLPTAPPEVAIGRASLREAVRSHPSETAVVIGMGGSSLWPDVLGRTFAPGASAEHGDGSRTEGGRSRALVVLDTTVPDAVEATLAGLDLERCLFFVASKSGSTIEPNALFELVHARLAEKLGVEAAGRHFVAITDPGSALEARAQELGFLGIALGRPEVGGRFSALSPFGLLPAEAMGLDPEALQARARLMSAACAGFVSPDHNPGVALGLALGTLARHGRDKLTLSLSPEIASFGGWVEQLVAESTGKLGRGVVPITGEPLDAPERYGDDRVFVDLALATDGSAKEREQALDALESAGHPVIRVRLAERADLVQEVFRWEIATAVLGSLLELNPFDQPDVEAAKVAARELMAQAGEGGTLPSREADLEAEGMRLFAGPALADAARQSGGDPARLMAVLVTSIEPGDCFALNAFLEDTPSHREALQSLRDAVGRARKVATTLDFGPRYLHSTGQLQKGGPDRLVGLQIWQSAGSRKGGPLPIPGLGGDFAVLAEAQAAGDFAVLAERGRRVIGLDVGPDPAAALSRLTGWIEAALSRA